MSASLHLTRGLEASGRRKKYGIKKGSRRSRSKTRSEMKAAVLAKEK